VGRTKAPSIIPNLNRIILIQDVQLLRCWTPSRTIQSHRTRSKRNLGLSVPQDWLSSSILKRGWLSPSGMSCPSVGISESGGIPESTSGSVGGGVLHGSKRSKWIVCRERLTVCLSTTTSGDLNDSIRQGPVQSSWSLRNLCRTGGLGQNIQTSWPSVNTVCFERSSLYNFCVLADDRVASRTRWWASRRVSFNSRTNGTVVRCGFSGGPAISAAGIITFRPNMAIFGVRPFVLCTVM